MPLLSRTYHSRAFHGEWRALFVSLFLSDPPINRSVSNRAEDSNPAQNAKGSRERCGLESRSNTTSRGKKSLPDGSVRWRTYGRSLSIFDSENLRGSWRLNALIVRRGREGRRMGPVASARNSQCSARDRYKRGGLCLGPNWGKEAEGGDR